MDSVEKAKEVPVRDLFAIFVHGPRRPIHCFGGTVVSVEMSLVLG